MTNLFDVVIRKPFYVELPAVNHMFMESWRYLVVDVLNKSVDDVVHMPVLDQSILAAFDRSGSPIGLLQIRGSSLEKLYVSPHALGCGVGSLLLHKAECLGVNTLHVDEDNHLARDFYERHGWVSSGEVNPGSVVPAWETLTYTKIM